MGLLKQFMVIFVSITQWINLQNVMVSFKDNEINKMQN